MRALIVEDVAVNRELLEALMQRHGECVSVASGEDAVEAFTEAWEDGRPFDIVFMDIMLPGMDGLQALETLRDLETQRGIPPQHQVMVIMTTALDDDANAARAFFQGRAVSYINKPLTLEKVEGELRNLGLLDQA